MIEVEVYHQSRMIESIDNVPSKPCVNETMMFSDVLYRVVHVKWKVVDYNYLLVEIDVVKA